MDASWIGTARTSCLGGSCRKIASVAHCPAELLDDLTDLLDEVRSWAGVVEKKPGVFYVRREPFLHFHLVEGGRRRADVKGRAGWVQLDLPRPASTARRHGPCAVSCVSDTEKKGRRYRPGGSADGPACPSKGPVGACPARATRRVQRRGGARRQPARRTGCTLSRLSRAPYLRRWALIIALARVSGS